jgi:hypothetical protein
MGRDILEQFRFQARKARNTFAALFIVSVAGICAALIPIGGNDAQESAAPATVENAPPADFPSAAGIDLALPLNSRPVYPYSIIPGGVSSPKELKSVIATDPVVASHYSGFDLAKARVIRLNKKLAAYVSYRKGNKVYGTPHKLIIHAGESIITDGLHSARTRCGNRISETAVKPVDAKEFLIAQLETPEPDARPFPLGSALAPWVGSNSVAPPGSDQGGFIAPIVPIIFGGGSPSHPSHNPPPTNPNSTGHSVVSSSS